jgi:hypothetical protein
MVKKPALSDKRAYFRLDSKIPVKYKALDSNEELKDKGYNIEQLSVTKNVSASGVLFLADEPLPVGSIFEIELGLPKGETIKCLSRVIRVEQDQAGGGYDIAVCFLDMTGSDRARLNSYMELETI